MIYKLKIRREDVGKKVPFPLVYLFEAHEMGKMRRAFSSFIGFPARHHMHVDWKDLKINKSIEGVTREGAEDCGEPLGEIIPDLLRKDDPWHFAVVILNRNRAPIGKEQVKEAQKARAKRRKKAEEEGRPADPEDLYGGQADYENPDNDAQSLAYLKDPRWKNPEHVADEHAPAYPQTAYFATEERVYEQVCHACPRLPFHIADKCHVGDAVCFQSLRKYFAPNMYKNLRAYDTFIEQLKEGNHEHVQNN